VPSALQVRRAHVPDAKLFSDVSLLTVEEGKWYRHAELHQTFSRSNVRGPPPASKAGSLSLPYLTKAVTFGTDWDFGQGDSGFFQCFPQPRRFKSGRFSRTRANAKDSVSENSKTKGLRRTRISSTASPAKRTNLE
jgi:hypothetical protein